MGNVNRARQKLTPEERRWLVENNPGYWLQTHGWIWDKTRTLVRPVLTVLQLRVVAAYCYMQYHGKPVRISGVKSRQEGLTTVCAACGYHHTRRFPTKSVAIADVEEHSKNLLTMHETFARNDEWDWGSEVDIQQKRLLYSNGSETVIASAERPSAAISSTLQGEHMSEIAYYKDGPVVNAAKLMQSVDGALFDGPNTFAFKESIAQGAKGVHYDIFQKARWPEWDDYWKRWPEVPQTSIADWNGYYRVFSAWWESPFYRTATTTEERAEIKATLTPRERNGVKRYKWTFEQIKWRRETIKSPEMLGDERTFDESYPEDPMRCWLGGGGMWFTPESINFYIDMAANAPPPKHWELVDQGERGVVRQEADQGDPSTAWFTEWAPPRRGFPHLGVCDPAMGESAVKTDPSKIDRHACKVWRCGGVEMRKDGQQIIHKPFLAGRLRYPCTVDFDEMVRRLVLMLRYYGGAEPIPLHYHAIKDGFTLFQELKRYQDVDGNRVRVPLVRRKNMNSLQDEAKELFGYLENESTRRYLFNSLAKAVNAREWVIHDPDTIAEYQSLIRNPRTGKPEAASGKHDDDCSADGLLAVAPNAGRAFQPFPVKSRLRTNYRTIIDAGGTPVGDMPSDLDDEGQPW